MSNPVIPSVWTMRVNNAQKCDVCDQKNRIMFVNSWRYGWRICQPCAIKEHAESLQKAPKFRTHVLDPYTVNWSKREGSLDPTTYWTESGEVKEDKKAVKKVTKTKSKAGKEHKKALDKEVNKKINKKADKNTDGETEMEE
jgi:hypothetical protein